VVSFEAHCLHTLNEGSERSSLNTVIHTDSTKKLREIGGPGSIQTE
jgi:hypothetical protein